MHAYGNLYGVKRRKQDIFSTFLGNPDAKEHYIMGASIYLLSFALPIYGMTGTGISVFTAFLGSIIITRPLIFSGSSDAAEILKKWGNYRIDGVTEFSENGPNDKKSEMPQIDRSSTKTPRKNIKKVLDLNIDPEEEKDESRDNRKIDAETGAERKAIKDEIKTAYERKDNAREDEENSDEPEYDYELEEEFDTDTYEEFKPILKTSRSGAIIFRAEDAEIISLENSRRFECPVCGESVPYNADRCPSCGVSFASLEIGQDVMKEIKEGIDEYGKSIIPEDMDIKLIHLDIQDGRAEIYGSIREDKEEAFSFNDDFLSGISVIN